MKQGNNSIPIVLILILIALIFLKPYYGWEVRKFLAPSLAGQDKSTADLAAENEALKAELAKLAGVKAELPERPANYIRAMVYARYPFNFKNELLIDVGALDGVSENSAVVASGTVLVGKVKKVFDDTAIVETVFDAGFQASARIGTSGVHALLRGGALPEITLIPLGADVASGDIVYSASPDFPYGLAIGEVENVATSSDQLFREATLQFAYDINSIGTVLVAK